MTLRSEDLMMIDDRPQSLQNLKRRRGKGWNDAATCQAQTNVV